MCSALTCAAVNTRNGVSRGRVEWISSRGRCMQEWGTNRGKMFHRLLIAVAKPTLAHSARRWIFHLGGLGFIPLGLLDASIIPVPGSMDVLTIGLCARRSDLWIYYAIMATIGSVLGGFTTYRLARKGGKEMLARRFSAKTLKRVYAIFEQWGFGAIAIPALLPPPVPMVPFVLAAGALQYSVQKFLAALTLGRAARFTLLAYLSARYGRRMLTYISQEGHPVLLTVIGLVIVLCAVFFFFFAGKRRQRRARA
jgi:membrane protein YqaA with SNARE-associated domain